MVIRKVMNMDELIDVLDKNGNKIGIKEKKLIKEDGDYHRAISVVIMNDNNEVLLQKRCMNKRIYPGLWSMFLKGHVRANEKNSDALIREIEEEIGIKVKKEELEFLYTIYEEKILPNYFERIFFDTYLLEKNIDLSSIKLNDEVDSVMYMKLGELRDLINSHDDRIVPNYLDYERIFPILMKEEKRKKLVK